MGGHARQGCAISERCTVVAGLTCSGAGLAKTLTKLRAASWISGARILWNADCHSCGNA